MIELIEKRLNELIPARDETIFEAVRYSLLGHGKRIRPLLTIGAAGVFGSDPIRSLDPACAIEMIHTYSLIHDDLPMMDNDDLRRGKPTLHKVYGEAMALLAGDYLLTFAFEVIMNAPYLSSEQKVKIVQILSSRAGAPGMIGGQAIDIEAKGELIDEDTLLQMHTGKTASLIIACLEVGSLIAFRPPAYPLHELGKMLGIAYQFQDDLLDATSTTAKIGKHTGKDAFHEKPNAVTIYGIDGLKNQLSLLKKSIFEKLNELPNQGSQLAIIIKQIFSRTS